MAQEGAAALPTVKAWRVKALSPESREAIAQEQIAAFQRALLLEHTNRNDVEGVLRKRVFLNDPTRDRAAQLTLRTAVAELRRKYGRDPTHRELSVALLISERSLYRSPFKQSLKIAFLEANLTGISAVEGVDQISDDPLQQEYARVVMSVFAKQRHPATRKRRRVNEGVRRKLTKRKSRSLELAWEEDRIHGIRGGVLLVFWATQAEARRRIAMMEQKQEGHKQIAKRYSRQLRRDLMLTADDGRFSLPAAGAYVRQQDGKVLWWVNFSTEKGFARSPSEARREILLCVTKAKCKFHINNLKQITEETDFAT